MVSRRALLATPLALAMLGGWGFLFMLRRMETGRFDPHAVPNPLLGQPAPALPGMPANSHTGAWLVNYFASWCAPCATEAAALRTLQSHGMPIWGVAYKDQPDNTARFLRRTGNPYMALLHDDAGQAAIDWGVTGVPETFLIDRAGIVREHWAGAIDPARVLQAVAGLQAATAP